MNKKADPEAFDTDSYRTPPDLYRGIRAYTQRSFFWDAACTEADAVASPLWRHPKFQCYDSLSAPWDVTGDIFVNPPYSKVDPWFAAAFAARPVVVMLSLSPNGEGRWDEILPRVHEVQITGWRDERGKSRNGRVAYIGANGKPKNGFNRGSSLYLFNTPGAGQRSTVTLHHLMELGRATRSGGKG